MSVYSLLFLLPPAMSSCILIGQFHKKWTMKILVLFVHLLDRGKPSSFRVRLEESTRRRHHHNSCAISSDSLGFNVVISNNHGWNLWTLMREYQKGDIPTKRDSLAKISFFQFLKVQPFNMLSRSIWWLIFMVFE